MSDDYFVLRVTLGFKIWILPFIILLIMLLGSNYQIEVQRSVNKELVNLAGSEIHRLHLELERCHAAFRRAEHRRQELLGLWEGE